MLNYLRYLVSATKVMVKMHAVIFMIYDYINFDSRIYPFSIANLYKALQVDG